MGNVDLLRRSLLRLETGADDVKVHSSLHAYKIHIL